MRKLTLQLDALAVDSFSPAPARTGHGTAHAHVADPVLLPPTPPAAATPATRRWTALPAS